MLITSGVLGGGTQGYDYRADLRAVYQYYCHNHPRADEPQYPLWMGLPKDSTLTRKELAKRIDACTGINTPAAQRTPAQKQNLANILNVVRIPERTLISHMSWATFMFRDLVQRSLGGRNPFTNVGVRYTGSTDDDALNRGVARFDADPAAVAQLADDSDMTGAIKVPEITMHAIHDPTAFVELETRYVRPFKNKSADVAVLCRRFGRRLIFRASILATLRNDEHRRTQKPQNQPILLTVTCVPAVTAFSAFTSPIALAQILQGLASRVSSPRLIGVRPKPIAIAVPSGQ